MKSLREEIPLNKKKIIKKSVQKNINFSFYIIILVVLFFFEKNNPDVTYPNILFTVAFLIFIITSLVLIPFHEYLYFKSYYYDIESNNILIRKGVLTRKEINLPFSKVTDIYMSQDFLDIIFGLYDVHISTPTAQSGSFAHIDGIDEEGSKKLKKLLINKID